MRWTEFESLLKNPAAITPTQMAELALLLKEYPYFIPAQLFRLKGLKELDSTTYTTTLAEVALYSTDRSFLSDYLNAPQKPQPPHLTQLQTPAPPMPFSQWLRIGKEPKCLSKSAEKPSDFQGKQPIIDAFLSRQAQIKPDESRPSSLTPAAFENPVPQADLMTETLARMYTEQKKYAQAIKAYRILALKYPEKSGFFADRIKSIQKLMSQ